MEYCSKCKMPKLERGLDRCYCEPTMDNMTEDKAEALIRELIAEALAGPQRCWLAPITDPTELKNLVVDPADLPVSVYCIGDSRVYDNTGTGWTYIDDDGFKQDVVLAMSSYVGSTVLYNGKTIGNVRSVSFKDSPLPIETLQEVQLMSCPVTEIFFMFGYLPESLVKGRDGNI